MSNALDFYFREDNAGERAVMLAQRCWAESGNDPRKCADIFAAAALNDPKIIEIIAGNEWHRLATLFLMKAIDKFEYNFRKGNLKLLSPEIIAERDERAAKTQASRNRRYRNRKRRGVIVVRAEVATETGNMNVIEADLDRFAGLKINGRSLLDVTTEEALRWSEMRGAEARFVQAVCALIPDPRKPIRTQLSKAMLAEALKTAGTFPIDIQ